MAIAPQRSEIGIRRHFTTEGLHPYDEVRWERRDARITNYRDGTVAFEQLDVEVPESWSVNATNILAQKYFRGTLNTPEREWSLRQVADRVADTLTEWGLKDGYFVDGDEARVFNHELKYLIIHQRAAFNSPVWFNIGVPGVPQQGSACQPVSRDAQYAERTRANRSARRGQRSRHEGVRLPWPHVDRRGQAQRAKASPAHPHQGRASARRDRRPPRVALKQLFDGPPSSPAAALRLPGDTLTWHRHDLAEPGHASAHETAEAALAGWLQSDGFVGQYEGTRTVHSPLMGDDGDGGRAAVGARRPRLGSSPMCTATNGRSRLLTPHLTVQAAAHVCTESVC